jgi:2-dehydro-3-deoxygalactonokinase
MPETRLIAIDWGTTSARAYALDGDGAVVAERSAPIGVQQIADGRFADALASLCTGIDSENSPMIACGMVGSRQGWIEAPYCNCPADLSAVALSITRVPGSRLAIVPGLMCRDADGVPDVMRGEETQVLGALSAGHAAHSVAVLPGTHCKWVIAGARGIERFSTFMTGELYAVLREHSILGRLAAPGIDDAALDEGVRRSLRRNAALSHDLFSARTRVLAGELAAQGVADYLSGLLLGAEIASALRWLEQSGVTEKLELTIVGEDALVERYRRALALAEIDSKPGPPKAAARGLWKIANKAGMVQA